EDYELLLTLDAEQVPAVARGLAAATGTPLTVVGEIQAGRGLTFLDGQGRPVGVPSGYEHFHDQRPRPPGGGAGAEAGNLEALPRSRGGLHLPRAGPLPGVGVAQQRP